MATPWLRQLHEHFRAEQWPALVELAAEIVRTEPTRPEPYGFAAHALRQLKRVEEGFEWAQRGLQVAPDDLFVLSRISLLGNLTERFQLVFELAVKHAHRTTSNVNDTFNLVMVIVNGIHAASKANRIAEAVEVFSGPIATLNHPELHFNAACLYALAGDERCFDFVERCLSAGKPVTMLGDHDLDRARGDPRFQRLLARDWERERAALARAKSTDRATLEPNHFVDASKLVSAPEVVSSLEEFVPLIERSPDEPEPWQVLFDWLAERGDVRAEAWAQWKAASIAGDTTDRMLAWCRWAQIMEAHVDTLVGPAKRWWPTVKWNGAFIERLRVDLDDRELGIGGLVQRPGLVEALGHPACRFLRHLEVRDLEGDDTDYDETLDIIAAAKLPILRSLRVEPDDMTRSWTSLSTSQLGTRFPRLEALELGAGTISLGVLDLPALRRFALRTTGLDRETLASIAAAFWPSLTSLELWFGSTDHGADAFEPADFTRLLSGTSLPKLVHLGLCNAEITDDLIDMLARTPLLRALNSLDLSLGTLTDAGASALLRHAPVLSHLERIDLTRNCMSIEAARDVSSRLPAVIAGDQKRHRYVSVAE